MKNSNCINDILKNMCNIDVLRNIINNGKNNKCLNILFKFFIYIKNYDLFILIIRFFKKL